MGTGPPVDEMLDIAASTAPLLERARDLVASLDQWIGAEAVWLTLSDPQSRAYATVGSSGLDQSTLDYLDRPSVTQEMKAVELDRRREPVGVSQLPVSVDELPTWADCHLPSDFREGLGVSLFEPDGLCLGMLTVLFSDAAAPSVALRSALSHVAPVIARGVSPMRSLLATARLVHGATAGAVLLQDGSTQALPGYTDHALLTPDGTVSQLSRQTLRSGQVYRSFLWPTGIGSGSSRHARVSVLAATDVPPYVLGTVLITPDVECRGLTPRELEVLGLVVAGRSNQQIARRLAIGLRTVATHVEHILDKLEVPTRTQAAVHAEREGCYVPAVRPGTR